MRARDGGGAQVTGRHLGREKNVLAGDAAVADRAPDLGFIAVDLRRIDMAIAELERLARRRVGARARHRPGAEAERRDLDAFYVDVLHRLSPSVPARSCL